MNVKKVLLVSIIVFLVCSTVGLFAQIDVTKAVLAKSDTPISHVTWNGDGKMFATAWNNSVILWDAESNTVASVFSGHKGPVKVVRFSKDNKWLLTLGQDNALIIRNMDYTVRETRINGKGSLPMRDAAFVDNGFAVIAPVDGFSTYHCQRLLLTQQFVTNALLESITPVYALDVSRGDSKLLVATQDGAVTILDLVTKRVINTFPRYSLSQVPPRFTPDGNYFIAAADRTSLVIAPVYGNGALVIRDSAQPVNTAEFSADGRKVAVALKDGGIKIFDTQTGAELYWYTVSAHEPDVVNSLAFSPDGEFLIAGTEAGYILRWSLSGKVFVPIKKAYENKDLVEAAWQYENGKAAAASEAPEEQTAEPAQEEPQPEEELQGAAAMRQFSISAGGETVPSGDYSGSVFVTAMYRSFRWYPFYCGFGGMCSIGFPSKDFTYHYNIDGKMTNPPYIYAATPLALAGLAGYIDAASLVTFAEIAAGPSIKILSNTDLSNLVVGSPYLGFNAALSAGVQWKYLQAALRVAFDSDFNAATGGLYVGYVWHFDTSTSASKAQ